MQFKSISLSLALAALSLAVAPFAMARGHGPSASSTKPAALAVATVAAQLSGNWSEDKAKREEFNQSIEWGSVLSFATTQGATSGTYTSTTDDGQVESGAWSLVAGGRGISPFEVRYTLTLAGDHQVDLMYNAQTDTLKLIGDHDEASSVFVRN